jgi:DNA-binding LacI/PurR family transcriptional regulator
LATQKRTRTTKAKNRRLDIRDVARHAHVSIATVSRTINRIPTVDKRLAERVWNSIRELNYFPNTQARALVSGRTRLLGLLISEITNPFFPELIRGFEDVAVENGYEILIGSTNYDPERMSLCIRRMLERNVEGVAVMTFGVEQPLLDELSSHHMPMVFVDAGPPGELVRPLLVDYQKGIGEGVQHLGALGHRKIGYISGPLLQRSSQLRKEAFLESVRKIGIHPAPSWLIEGDHTLEGGMRAMEQLLSLQERPTAVMCSNDMTAIGSLRVLIRSGYRVPEDFSVVGYDDIHLAEFVYPPLTTVRMSRDDLARAAFETLRSILENPEVHVKPKDRCVPTSLVVRQSTGPVKKTSPAANRISSTGAGKVKRPKSAAKANA